MGALSARYKKQQKRDDAIRLALGGSALGFMVGPPFGAFMYEYYGKTTPFAVLSGISLIEGGTQKCNITFTINYKKKKYHLCQKLTFIYQFCTSKLNSKPTFQLTTRIYIIYTGLELIMKQPKLNQAQLMKPSLWVLLKDPYIVIAASEYYRSLKF